MASHSTDITMVLFSTTGGNSPETNRTAYSPEVVLLISTAAGICSLVTVLGNVVVILSFFINKSLRNFSNYMILSLAMSDLTIGAFSMNVFTTYNVNQKWILGPAMCKAWLSVDYTASNASVMNLLVICVDRYLAITKPVKYKRWCTPSSAARAIFLVWTLSFLVWVPAITLWDVISPNATLDSGQCYIPFINDSPALSVATIIGAFYFPAFFMCVLYKRVIYKIKHRRSGIGSIIRDASAQPDVAKKKVNFRFLKRFRRKNHSIEEERMKESSSGSNQSPMSVNVNDVIPNEQNASRDGAGGRKNLTIEISDNSSPCSPGVKSRASNLSTTKNGNFDRNGGRESDAVPTKFIYCQRAIHMNGSLSPALGQIAHYEARTQSVNSFACSEQTRVLLAHKVTPEKDSLKTNREHRVTVLLKFILLCFIILWLPYSLIVIVAAVCPDKVPPYVWNLSYWLCYLNSTVNPICYGLCNENFRRTFKAIVTTRWWTKESRKLLRAGRRSIDRKRQIIKKEQFKRSKVNF